MGPDHRAGKSIAFWLALAVTLGFVVLTLFVAWGWGIASFGFLYLVAAPQGHPALRGRR